MRNYKAQLFAFGALPASHVHLSVLLDMNQFRQYIIKGLACLVTMLMPFQLSASSLIRDVEIEHTLRVYSNPIFQAARLSPENVNIFIVQNPELNAYVAGGANVFLNTGLIMASDNPTMLMGVIAHEAGHIAGGHLARGSEELENAHISTILTYVLGAAAAIGGSADVGSAVMSAGQHLAQRNLLSFTRTNEQSADQAALEYLDKVGVSAGGLLELLQKLRVRETVYRNQIDPYALTHPLSKERVAHLRSHLLQKGEGVEIAPRYKELHARMVAKLEGFLVKPETVLEKYPDTDQSMSARYARSVAYHRLSKRGSAIKEIDSLLKEEPEDPYFLELKGQILSENGMHAEALPFYRQAAQLLPESALLRSAYAREIMAQAEPEYKTALLELKQATLRDPFDRTSWLLLADCQAALGNMGDAALAHAEAALLGHRAKQAVQYAKTALKKLPNATPAAMRAQDLLREAKRVEEEREKKAN